MSKGGDDTCGSDALHEIARSVHQRIVEEWTPALREKAERAAWAVAQLGRDGCTKRVKRLGRSKGDLALVWVEGEPQPRYVASERLPEEP